MAPGILGGATTAFWNVPHELRIKIVARRRPTAANVLRDRMNVDPGTTDKRLNRACACLKRIFRLEFRGWVRSWFAPCVNQGEFLFPNLGFPDGNPQARGRVQVGLRGFEMAQWDDETTNRKIGKEMERRSFRRWNETQAPKSPTKQLRGDTEAGSSVR